MIWGSYLFFDDLSFPLVLFRLCHSSDFAAVAAVFAEESNKLPWWHPQQQGCIEAYYKQEDEQ
jgi:hypothetical protein